jgi:hypothetical protein
MPQDSGCITSEEAGHQHEMNQDHTMKPFKARLIILLTLIASLAACQHAAPLDAPASVSHLQKEDSIQELMQAYVDPAANAIWNSGSTTITKDGVEERVAQTDADWQGIRQHALRLIEGYSLLEMPGRKVAQDGVKLKDENVEGNAKLSDIVSRIDKDPVAFSNAAKNSRGAALQVLAAVDARDPERLDEAGSALNASCESCHLNYWYPTQELPR